MISTFDNEFLKENNKLIRSLLESSSPEDLKKLTQNHEEAREFFQQIRIHDRNVTRLRDVRVDRNTHTR